MNIQNVHCGLKYELMTTIAVKRYQLLKAVDKKKEKEKKSGLNETRPHDLCDLSLFDFWSDCFRGIELSQ